jgi:hypothetical protein
MLPPTFESGDKVVLRDDRREIQGVVGAVQGAEITLRTEGVRRLARRTEPIPAARETLPLPPIHERLTLLSQLVEMIAHRFAPSLILVGPPGLGKTHEVTRTLKALGLEKDHDYFHIKGYASARGLYETLFNHNDRVIVFDDCDNALTDAVAVELLKGALDSYDVRTIAWLSASRKAGPIPPRFDFTGGVVFVSNRSLADIDGPIHTRSLVIDLEMTRAEILERMEALLPSFKTNATAQQRRLAMDFIRRWAPSIQQLSLRTFISVVRIIQAHPRNWERLAIYATTR